MTQSPNREKEYCQKGDYHKQLDKDWRYYPVYIEKIRLIREFLSRQGKEKKILDLGCGEGVLVEEFRSQGYLVDGLDLNYESQFVKKGSILETGYADSSYDIVLCLDVLEHLQFEEQEKAICEMKRVLKPGGLLVLSLPNLAHFASRITFLLLGKLLRTSEPERHPGDRPIGEFLFSLFRWPADAIKLFLVRPDIF